MNDEILNISTNKLRVVITQCPIMADPREEYEHLGKMCIGSSGSRYRDVREYNDMNGAEFHEHMLTLTQEERDAEFMVILPVYRYEHSGVAYSTSSFGCQWDSGQVGYISMSREVAELDWIKATPEELLVHATECLKAEVETYSAWANGDVYEYTIEKAVTCPCCDHVRWEEYDSCCGFYGDYVESGMKETIIDVLKVADKDMTEADRMELIQKIEKVM